GLFAWLTALAIRKLGYLALLLAPVFWTTFEWVRLGVTGQLWNALGYSQAYHPHLIQPAEWGGVYAVSFLIVVSNSVVALLIIRRTKLTIATAVVFTLAAAFIILDSERSIIVDYLYSEKNDVQVVAVQPNVPMTPAKSEAEIKELFERHVSLSEKGLNSISDR